MSAPYEFVSLVAIESRATRGAVERWARKLWDDQQRIWSRNQEQGERNKSRPPTIDECREKSRQIRLKRERDDSYFHRLT